MVSRDEGKGADKVKVKIQVATVISTTTIMPILLHVPIRMIQAAQRIDNCIYAEMNQAKL